MFQFILLTEIDGTYGTRIVLFDFVRIRNGALAKIASTSKSDDLVAGHGGLWLLRFLGAEARRHRGGTWDQW